MPFLRTVLGDIPPSELGLCHSHEHLICEAGYPTELHPDFLLDSAELCVHELTEVQEVGGSSMVDCTPCACGRNPEKLAEVSRRSGLHVIASTGAHLAKYYPLGHWTGGYTVDQLARLFIEDLSVGMDAHDYTGPLIRRTEHRAGVIKLATGGTRLTDRENRLFMAGAMAHLQTGSPIITHVEQGFGGLEQVSVFNETAVDLRHVVLSHTDRNPSLSYHRELLSTGVNLEYDSAFRWKAEQGNPTLDLLCALVEEFPGQLLLGLDAARRGYWRSYGGAPGLAFLLRDFRQAMRERGIPGERVDAIFRENPARVFAFREQP